MSIFWIVFIIALIYLGFKIGMEALKWVLVLVAVVFVFWFFTAGGGVKIDKPSNMPNLPSFPINK
jgi:hypothetical protein